MNGDKSGGKLSRSFVFSSVFFRPSSPFCIAANGKSEKEIDKQSSHSASRFLKREKSVVNSRTPLCQTRVLKGIRPNVAPPSIPSVMPRSTRVSVRQCRLIE